MYSILNTLCAAWCGKSLFELLKIIKTKNDVSPSDPSEISTYLIAFILTFLGVIAFFLLSNRDKNKNTISTINYQLKEIYRRWNYHNKKDTRIKIKPNNEIDYEITLDCYNKTKTKKEKRHGWGIKGLFSKSPIIILLIFLSYQAFSQPLSFSKQSTSNYFETYSIIISLIAILIAFITILLSLIKDARTKEQISELTEEIQRQQFENYKLYDKVYCELKHRLNQTEIEHDPEAIFNLGKESLLDGNYSFAIDCFSEAIRINSQEFKYYEYRADTYIQMGDYDKSIDDFKKALIMLNNSNVDSIRIRHKLAALYNNIGNIIAAENNYAEAFEKVKELSSLEAKTNYNETINVLNDYGTLLLSLNKFSVAKDVLSKALKICYSIEINTEDKKVLMAMTLNNYAILLKKLFETDSAEDKYKTALSIYKELDKATPGKYLADIAMSLNNLGNLYYSTNHFGEAFSMYTESLKIRRNLASQNPDKYISDVADTLNNFANLYREQFEKEKALEKYQEALDIRRQLAEKNPDTFLPDVATTLYDIAALHDDINNYDEAEAEYQEALDIRRKLAEKNPDAFLPDVADTLNRLAIVHDKKQNYNEAEKEYREALIIYRRLAEENSNAFLPYVAKILNNLAINHCDTKHYQKAEEEYEEALTIRQKLAEKEPDSFLPEVARVLKNLANLHFVINHFDKAEKEYEEALTIYRQLAEKNPGAFMPIVAETLNGLANTHTVFNNQYDVAEKEWQEALTIDRQLAEKNPDIFLPSLAKTIHNMALSHSLQSNHKSVEAEAECQEALDIFRKLAKQKPNAFLYDMALSLSLIAYLHLHQNNLEKAEIEAKESLKLFQQLAERSHEAFDIFVDKTLQLIDDISNANVKCKT